MLNHVITHTYVRVYTIECAGLSYESNLNISFGKQLYVFQQFNCMNTVSSPAHFTMGVTCSGIKLGNFC